MFSVATMTALAFVIFLVILGVTIWIDGKKTYILPPKLNYQGGGEEISEENASAEYKANTKNGDLIVKVSANDLGKASAWAALGYEYENTASDKRVLIIVLTFKYRIKLDLDQSQSATRAKIETFVNSNSVAITEENLTSPSPEGAKKKDEFVNSKQRHVVFLDAGENFTAYLKITLEAEAGAGGNCGGEIIANLSEIFHRPELRPM
ncbi:MAG: hypothetical protein L0Y39_01990 [Methylococcaceae bacterium]|nr:hypothetical protein [Methylococcaceae bacterium]